MKQANSKRLVLIAAALLVWTASATEAPAQGPAETSPEPTAASASTNVAGATADALEQYCVTCHNPQVNAGELRLDQMDLSEVEGDVAAWEKVARKVRAGLMPPAGAPRPPEAVLETLATEVESRLDTAAASNPNPGNPGLHRLNRTEYGNAIRDLLDLDVDVETLLPAESSSEGFDNIAAALAISPELIQSYLTAAMKISRRAVGDRTQIQTQTIYQAPPTLAQDRHIEGLPLGTRGGMLVEHSFPLDGTYHITTNARGVAGARGGGSDRLIGRGGDGFSGGANNIPGPLLDVTLDGERLQVEDSRDFSIPIEAGPHTLSLALIDQRRPAGVDDIYNVYAPAGAVNSVTIDGPIDPTGVGDTPSRRRIFACYPEDPSEEEACAEQIVSGLARRAFRREITSEDIQTLMRFYQQGRREGDFEVGIQQALARLLMSPPFLFRTEEEPDGIRPGAVYPLDDFALASRLSFFLWSSIPDDELLDLASRELLSDPTVREAQVRRMLADPKSKALITNFAAQWLYLRELEGIQPEASNFDDNLRHAFLRETEMLLEDIVRQDLSILSLLDADYTYVNERLAEHYGIPDIRGSHFRRVALAPDSPRRGLLGHGSFLTVSSITTRTSPVIRGKWILENLLGSPPPNPPPGVEVNLDEDAEAATVTSLRQRLEAHRESPVCASCHQIMDPIGLALENFDHVGTWRDVDGGMPIDATGELVDGTPLSGPIDVRNAVMAKSHVFATTVTEKLLTYALGRSLEPHDMPTVRAMLRNVARDDYSFSSIVLGIADSIPFGMKVKQP